MKYWPLPDETDDFMTYTGLLTVVSLAETATEYYRMREFELSFKSSVSTVWCILVLWYLCLRDTDPRGERWLWFKFTSTHFGACCSYTPLYGEIEKNKGQVFG